LLSILLFAKSISANNSASIACTFHDWASLGKARSPQIANYVAASAMGLLLFHLWPCLIAYLFKEENFPSFPSQ